jgi:lipopolysaccharide transport system ATP-binding protein
VGGSGRLKRIGSHSNILIHPRINHNTRTYDKSRSGLKIIQTLPLTRRPTKKRSFFRKQHHKDFVAPGNISFEIGSNQTPGIIGWNCAGKSTLLKILSGILIPERGTIRIDGKVTGLLELGTGFNYEMTG